MKASFPSFFLLLCSFYCSAQMFVIPKSDTAEEKIWKLEEAYFTNLYKADYKGVLSLVDEQFLGWPHTIKADRQERERSFYEETHARAFKMQY